MAVNTFVKDSKGMAYVDESGNFKEVTKVVVIGGTSYKVVNGYLANQCHINWLKQAIILRRQEFPAGACFAHSINR